MPTPEEVAPLDRREHPATEEDRYEQRRALIEAEDRATIAHDREVFIQYATRIPTREQRHAALADALRSVALSASLVEYVGRLYGPAAVRAD